MSLLRNFLCKFIFTTFQEKRKTFFFSKMEIVSIVIIYSKYILSLIRWVWLLCFITFSVKRNYFIFDLRNFSFDTDQNATFLALTYLKLAQFSYTDLGNFPDDFIPLNKLHNFDTSILATFMIIGMFLIEWHHSYTEIGKLPDDFMTWTRYTILIGWIFCIFLVYYEKNR